MAQGHGSLAKITRPVVSDVVQRERLFHLLDDGRNRPITWISAPGGSGKTTLVSSYLDVRKLHCLWYQVDEGDNDIASFFYYMGMAARKGVPQRRKPLPLLTPEYLPGLPVFTRRYFEELYGRLKPPSVIVFDNYQDVPSGSEFHEVINKGLSLIPVGISVIVISRTAPPPKFVRLRANNRINSIEWEEVRFTRDEAAELILFSGHEEIAERTLDELHEKTDGWAAGLVLLLEKAKRSGLTPELLAKVTRNDIFDYFAAEIFDSGDDETRDFLLKSAFLPQVSPQIAERLTGVENAGRILARLSHDHFFTTRQRERHISYQYHALFREFLLSRATAIFTSKEISGIREKAALLLTAQGEFEGAAELYCKAEAWQEVVHIIRSHAQELFGQGRSDVILKWLGAMPENIVESDPHLLYWKGMGTMALSPLESRHMFEKALELFESQNDRLWMFFSWAGAVDMSLHIGDYTYLDELIGLFEDFIREGFSYLPSEAESRMSASVFNALALRQPYRKDIDKWERRAVAILHEDLDLNLRFQLGIYLGLYHLWMGHFSRARLVLQSLTKAASSRELSDLLFISIKNLDALSDYFIGSHKTGQHKIDEALERAAKTGVHVWSNHLKSIRASMALGEGDFATATRTLEDLSCGIDTARIFDKGYYHYLCAWKALLQGKVDDALEHAFLSVDFVTVAGFTSCQSFSNLVLAEILHEKGDEKRASEYLLAAREIAEHIKSKFMVFSCFLAEANMTLDCGDYEAALSVLSKAMEIGRQQDFMNVLMWRPAIMTKLCTKALEHDIEVGYVQRIIRRRSLVPDSLPLGIEHWPWPLKIHTLGRFSVEKDGNPLDLHGASRKSLDILKLIIALGGREIREERITEVLWPDADGDAAHSAFTTTLSRLRKLIGEDALTVKGGKVSLNPMNCWVDVAAFDYLLSQQETRRKDQDSARHLPEKIFALYRGPFLAEDLDEQHFYLVRERARQKFLSFVGRWGEPLIQKQHYEDAIVIYKKGLEIDELSEEFHRGLMSCYLGLGRYAEGLAVYRRCRDLLLRTFDVAPSRQTEDLHRALKQKR